MLMNEIFSAAKAPAAEANRKTRASHAILRHIAVSWRERDNVGLAEIAPP
jgi:hypothetical protein